MEEWTKNEKVFSTALATTIKKDPTTSIRKHTNELKVNVKTVKTAIKQNLSPDLNPAPIQILVHLWLLIGRNRIKCLKNLFWKHENRLEGVLIL